MTRAWTLQEALFSRRLVIFTDLEVGFECDKHYQWETENPAVIRSKSLHDRNFRQIGETLGQLTPNPLDAVTCIEKFSYRYLGNADDTLIALYGVLQAYETNVS